MMQFFRIAESLGWQARGGPSKKGINLSSKKPQPDHDIVRTKTKRRVGRKRERKDRLIWTFPSVPPSVAVPENYRGSKKEGNNRKVGGS